ncbi:putative phosphatidylglycerol/phosphatidylinositol transfer protein DDB_G0282179 [Tripterygium wilfordii]|uniref:putative phosphatidylglycerol/phosphatidylinositol transfer protein DDB_G0282179 n=1 Tax=Tripterygium wilfordii TaxID=458696 RepID=UPI0018F84F5C|nr:putative phosphatidylglycerol/phosphatidylinositol transfer protein DDB_G0282179 [Tripterygium wilfordii]
MEMIQSNLIVPLFLSLCLMVALTRATDVKYCDKNTEYKVKVKGVEISPDPVERGESASFSISATTDEAISRGKLVIEVSYFGWHIHSETHNLCAETSCPVSIGDFVVYHSQLVPGYTPPGSYSLKMKIYDGNKSELTCIAFDFAIGFAYLWLLVKCYERSYRLLINGLYLQFIPCTFSQLCWNICCPCWYYSQQHVAGYILNVLST